MVFSVRMVGLCAGASLSLASIASADVVTDWNVQAISTITATSTPPPRAARALAMVHTAVFDAVNAVDQSYQSYLPGFSAAPDTSREAAAIIAAHSVLSSVYSGNATQLAAFNSLRDSQLAAIPNSPGKTAGITLGTNVGAAMIANRASDNSTNVVAFPGSTDPGRWRPAADNPAAAALPQWGGVTTFCGFSGANFRPPPPPSLTSPEYAAAVNEVKAIGRGTGSTRTAEQTSIARAWAFNAGTATPPGAWNIITRDVVATQSNSLLQNARTFAMLNVALADAGICAWDCKYTLDMWRPIDAIRLADTDGNAATDPDAAWVPLLSPTPNHPTYVSGHSTFSRAAATILQAALGTDSINVTFNGDFGEVRMLTSLDAAANEAGLSRIYGGIHFNFDNIFGQQVGLNVGNFVAQNLFQPIPSPGTGAGFAILGLAALGRRRR